MDENLIKEIKQIIRSYRFKIDLNLPDNLLIQEVEYKFNWVWISRYRKLSESFIEKFQDELEWLSISTDQILSEKFIEKFQYKVQWTNISGFQNLSEKFIEKFQDKINWDNISIAQNLSVDFILKYWNRLNHEFIIMKQKSLTPDFLLWLYKTDQEEEYNLLKNRYGFKNYSKMIECQIPKVLIEF